DLHPLRRVAAHLDQAVVRVAAVADRQVAAGHGRGRWDRARPGRRDLEPARLPETVPAFVPVLSVLFVLSGLLPVLVHGRVSALGLARGLLALLAAAGKQQGQDGGAEDRRVHGSTPMVRRKPVGGGRWRRSRRAPPGAIQKRTLSPACSVRGMPGWRMASSGPARSRTLNVPTWSLSARLRASANSCQRSRSMPRRRPSRL